MQNNHVLEFVQDLCAHMGVSECQVDLEESEQDLQINLLVPEAESGMLIGYHGETITSLQILVNSVFYKKDLEQKKILFNVNDYRQKREEVLQNMAQKYVQRVIDSGNPQVLPYLPSNERLIIHVFLKDHPEVITESEGEGLSRRLVVKLKNQQ